MKSSVRHAAATALVLSLASACLETRIPFRCQGHDQCLRGDEQGTCEPNGYCAFVDPGCKTGRRFAYHAAAGESGRCTHCGDGVVDQGEECDDGNPSDADACLSTCRFNRCGDGIVRSEVEECDDGNDRNNDGCTTSCLTCKAGDSAFHWDVTRHCYARHAAPEPWEAAERTCEAAFGHLAVYTSDAEANAVSQRLLPSLLGPHWIGLRDELPMGTSFTWITSEAFGGGALSGWARGTSMNRPDDSCMSQAAQEPWLGQPCATPLPFVCEYEPWIVRKTDNHAYRAFWMRLPWNEARDYCVERGGHLATVTDAEERTFVSAQFFGAYWIGGTRAPNAQAFSWVTGERFDPGDFSPGEPSEPRTSAACVLIGANDRLLRDRSCANALYFVCERE